MAADTRTWRWWSRCQAIVCGPASRPCPASSLCSPVISPTTSAAIAAGEVFGRRDRQLERRLPLRPVPGQQRVNPRPGHPVAAGDLADRALLDSDSGNAKTGFRHPRTLRPGCPRCPETRRRRCQISATARRAPAGSSTHGPELSVANVTMSICTNAMSGTGQWRLSKAARPCAPSACA